MARTWGVEGGNQVATPNGRHVLAGWMGNRVWLNCPPDSNTSKLCSGAASQSLSRDLTMSAQSELLQQFVPELQGLRIVGSKQEAHRMHIERRGSGTAAPVAAAAVAIVGGSMQLEVVATFSFAQNPTHSFGLSMLSGAANVTIGNCTANDATLGGRGGCMIWDVVGRLKAQNAAFPNASYSPFAIPVLPAASKHISVHTIIDGVQIETIVNNRSAFAYSAWRKFAVADTEVALFGVGGTTGVTATLVTWRLKDTGNNAPVPLETETGDDDSSAVAACAGVFFVYFEEDQLMRFALSRDGMHFTPLLQQRCNNGKMCGSPVPDFDGPNTTSIRDPFLRFDPRSKLYRMVATDGYRFGHDAQIWEWHSADLVNWSKQRAINVMAKYSGQFQDTW